MTVGEDFAAFTCDFQNLSFCGAQPGNVRGELGYNWPVSQWGTRVKWAPTGETSLQLGVYQVDSRYIDDGYASHHGLVPDNPFGTTGALIPIEFAWSPKPAGLPGSYKVGAWYDSSNAADAYLDTHRQPIALTGGAPLQRDSRSGVYVNFSQRIIGTATGRGATVFFNATQSDRSTATSMDRQVSLGLLYTGPFDRRPSDAIGIAIGSSHVNDRIADGLRIANALDRGDRPLPGSETVGELFYAWAPRPYFHLQPNLQFIRHPGGIGSNASVLVIGLRTSVDF
jgi:porin